MEDAEYWTRTWILQEILLATRACIITDTCFLPLETYYAFYRRFGSNKEPMSRLFYKKFRQTKSTIIGEENYFEEANLPGGERSLPEMMHMAEDSHCSDIRDKICALLGLDPRAGGFAVDYNESLAALGRRVLAHFATQEIRSLLRFMDNLSRVLKLFPAVICAHLSDCSALLSGILGSYGVDAHCSLQSSPVAGFLLMLSDASSADSFDHRQWLLYFKHPARLCRECSNVLFLGKKYNLFWQVESERIWIVIRTISTLYGDRNEQYMEPDE